MLNNRVQEAKDCSHLSTCCICPQRHSRIMSCTVSHSSPVQQAADLQPSTPGLPSQGCPACCAVAQGLTGGVQQQAISGEGSTGGASAAAQAAHALPRVEGQEAHRISPQQSHQGLRCSSWRHGMPVQRRIMIICQLGTPGGW